jgi:membrane protein implicated in regulation of membrane protease activity
MAQPRSSVVAELGWLGFFLLIFAAFMYAFVGLLVPHHFNDKIAIVLAAIFAGLLMIVTRAWMTRRLGPR